MRLTMNERRAVTRVMANRYQKATKKEEGRMLDEFIQLTGYNRSYGSHLLSRQGRKVWLGPRRAVIGDVTRRLRRPRQRLYDDAVVAALKQIWAIMDWICGKRLAPILPEVIRVLEQHQEIGLDSVVRAKLQRISPSTIDRLLGPERKKRALKRRAKTKPGTLLKQQIPIRTFAQWDEQRPGFVEVDLVAHDGGRAQGDYAQTLDLTDVCSGWTETQAVANKAQRWVFEALHQIEQRLPFPLLGLDSDNGAEFINAHLLRFCQQHQITFTRARPYRKNDNCYVEQKNYSVVRRAVGYRRYDTDRARELLNQLYADLRLYTNYFQPVMKLKHKTRQGSRVIKTYDRPETPYQRLLQSPSVSDDSKRRLRKHYATLNPARLKRQITALQAQLFKLPTGDSDQRRRDLTMMHKPQQQTRPTQKQKMGPIAQPFHLDFS